MDPHVIHACMEERMDIACTGTSGVHEKHKHDITDDIETGKKVSCK